MEIVPIYEDPNLIYDKYPNQDGTNGFHKNTEVKQIVLEENKEDVSLNGAIRFTYQGESYDLKIPENKRQTQAIINLRSLFGRTRGACFRVENGGLFEITKEMGYWDRRRCKQRDEIAKVRDAINAALKELAEIAKVQKGMNTDIVVEAAVRFLFDKKEDKGIGQLSERLYDRKIYTGTDESLDSYLKKVEDVVLSDEKDKHNLSMLRTRQKGVRYGVDSEGKLYRKRWRYNKAEDEPGVRDVVADIIKKLNIYAENHKIYKFAIKEILAPDGAIARMSRQRYNAEGKVVGGLFDRSVVEEDSALEEILNGNISKIRDDLAEALEKLENAVKNTEPNNERRVEIRNSVVKNLFRNKKIYTELIQHLFNTQGPDSEKVPQINALKRDVEHAFMELAYEEFRVAQHLGIDLERNTDGGSGGARYARDRFGRKILVVKAADEGPHGINNPQWYAPLKRLFVSVRKIFKNNSEAIAEKSSHLADRNLGLWTVPPTSLRYVESVQFVRARVKHCSIQMFMPNFTTLQDALDIPKSIRSIFKSRQSLREQYADNRVVIEKWPQKQAETFATQNMVIEDTDAHFENGGYSKWEEPTNEMLASIFQGVDIKNVKFDKSTTFKHDAGFSSPDGHPNPKAFLTLRFEHFFEIFPHFAQPFSEETKNRIVGQEERFANFLMEKAVTDLEAVIKPEVFDLFWKKPENRKLLREWVFENDFHSKKRGRFQTYQTTEEETKREKLIQALQKAENEFLGIAEPKKMRRNDKKIESEINKEKKKEEHVVKIEIEKNEKPVVVKRKVTRALGGHLRHIKKNLHARIDSYRVFYDFLNNKNGKPHPVHKSRNYNMRDLFTEVRTDVEFRKRLSTLNDDGFAQKMKGWQEKNVGKKVIAPRTNADTPLSSRAIIEGFGGDFV